MKNPRKKNTLLYILILTLTLTLVHAQPNTPQTQIGAPFTVPELKIHPNPYIADYQDEDVTGDKTPDRIILVGTKEKKDQLYTPKVYIVVQDGKTQKYAVASAGTFGGYNPKFFIGDFNKDKISDILVSMDSGGSGGTIFASMFSFVNLTPKILIDQQTLSRGVQFEGKFVNGFKAEIKVKDFPRGFTLDISANKGTYIQNGVYDENGNLLKETEISADGFGALNPIDWDGDGTYELMGYQRIWGVFHADILSRTESLLDFEDSKWQIRRLTYTTTLAE